MLENNKTNIMDMITKIKNQIKKIEEPSPNVFFGFGNEQKSTWFITKNKNALLPQGSRLLFEIKGVDTDEYISTKDSYPQINDIICLVDGKNIKIIDVKWI